MRASSPILLFASLLSPVVFAGGFERSANFDVFTPTVTSQEDSQHFARTVLERAEQYRKEVAVTWLGEELPPSIGRTTINVSFSDRDYGLTWAKDDQRRKYHTIYLSTTPDRALEHILAHEMVHVILATRYPHPKRLPAWIEEGIASRYDDPERKQTRAQIVGWWVKTKKWPSLAAVLRAENISADDESAYALAASMSDYLLTLRDKKMLLHFGEASLEDIDQALRAHYSIDSVDELQRRWQQWATNAQATAARPSPAAPITR